MSKRLQHLFVYGTLAPGRSNEHILATIVGTWQKAKVIGFLHEEGWGATMGYPAIVIDEAGDDVHGFVLSSYELEQHWSRLDEFEGEAYERILTKVTLDTTKSIDAFVYALKRKDIHASAV